ncbi:hypothetical protein [Deinococcus enclensis]|uniref:Uncharacterized protein n=1 Tax=Deinococcus enclensis TaxID=1049582 RepID=A0ABT9ME69_9DEIO|nr:hypothetical protein [Deinococcus enclensis]MDP9764868.1 hypothetical protein [Deinococcus enclensis]
MELRAAGPDPAVIAYGAYLHGGRLRCPLLLVRHGHTARDVTLTDPTSNQEIHVRLPEEATGHTGHLRFDREELEIL